MKYVTISLMALASLASAAPTRFSGFSPSSLGSFGSFGSFGGSGRGGSSENGVKEKKSCTPLTVIFARGTGEGGNVGSVVGPPLFKALRAKMGADKVTIQGVDYPASFAVSLQPYEHQSLV